MRHLSVPLTLIVSCIPLVLGCNPSPTTTMQMQTSRSEAEGMQGDVKRVLDDPKLRDKLLEHPIFKRSEWLKKDGTARREAPDPGDGKRPSEEVVVEELLLNDAEVKRDSEGHVTELHLSHWKWNEPKKLVDPGLGLLTYLPKLHTLFLYNTATTDKGLQHLRGLSDLRVLELGYSEITDNGLEEIRGLTKLETLGLKNTSISDDGLRHLKEMRNLRLLDLDGDKITDAGLIHLKEFAKLEKLHIQFSNVTQNGVVGVKKALPNCEITWK